MATNGTAKQPRSKRRKDTLRYYSELWTELGI